MTATFRVTHRSGSALMVNGLQRSLARLQDTQERMSTGRQINRPSDSPGGTVTALRLRSEMARTEQYARNADDGLGWLGTADTVLQSALDTLRRARELTIGAQSGAIGAEARQATASEVDNLRAALLEVANTRYGNRLVFAGASPADAAYADTGTYRGDATPINRTLAAGVTVPFTLTGPEVFGPDGSSVFDVLAKLATDLRSDATGALDARLGELDTSAERMRGALATIGARYNRVETLQQKANDQLLTVRSSLSEVEDIDLPKTIVDLQMQEMAYKAALGVTARVIQPSLLDFLR
ncbi:MAG TPA: flagellar hook-associated protein FlgL [Mycobacteriales bacterium]|nr:flagellar hook-associated protein FlgL [Mycobacteriales bacterium]